MRRTYLATLDNGHDYQELTYLSEHRNGSKANLEDCRDEMQRKYGFRESRRWEIKSTMLFDD